MGRVPVDKPRINNINKQREITSALFPHFMRIGIDKMSTEKMCELSGKSKATLYKYFESKKEIVHFILSSRLKELARFEEILFDSNKGYADRYREAVGITIEVIEGITPLFLRETKSNFPDLFEGILSLKNLTIQLLTKFYKQGIENEIFINMSPEVMSFNDELFFTALLESDYMEHQNVDLKILFEGYFRIRFNGILK